jgi:hypothetical protein
VVRTEFVRPTIPAVAKVKCADPVATPRGRRLTDKETGDFWAVDRAALRTCEIRRSAAVNAAEVD